MSAAEWGRRRSMLLDLQTEWKRVFGEEVGIGFEIGVAQVPLLERCLGERDQAPLQEYLQNLDPDRDY